MSYKKMAQEEFGCDFPGCQKNFWTKENAWVAAVRDGDFVAFCREHSKELLEKGASLRTLEEVRIELGIDKSEEEIRTTRDA